uniref:Cytochrome P450 4V2 n=1 Tax=Panagrellus redivivus TaxID=6233 RepID=A0A7E4W561_PANRE
MAIALPLLIIGAVVGSCYLLWIHLKLRKRFHGIPSPRSYPVIGHLPIVKPDVQGFIDQIIGLAYLYPDQPRMVTVWIGFMPMIMVYGPEALEPIFSNSAHLNKTVLYQMLVPWLGQGLLTSSAEKWRPRRKLLTPTFHYDILKNFVDVFNDQAQVLVHKLKAITANCRDEPIEISKHVTLCALDIICETSMGRSVNAQQDPDSEYLRAVKRIIEIIQRRQMNPIFWIDCLFNLFGDGKEHKWALDVLHSFTKKVIDERRKDNKTDGIAKAERLAFLDLLLAMEDRGEISLKDVQEEVDTFMFEGHDTTAAGIAWALHLIGNHEDVQEQIAEELAQILGQDEDISYEHLGRMKYLECVIKECLRLQPSVPMFGRVLGTDQDVGGFTIPKGTQVIVNPYLIHRDPRHWKNPEKFDPDRFLPENTKGRHAFAYVPFSAGSRNCIGQRFALMEEKTIIASIIREFKMTSIKRRDELGFKSELILRPIDGIHVTLTPRV